MRFLLVDQITEWKSGKRITGIKNVAMSEDFFEFHFPKNPIMPGILLVEGLAQLAGWLEAESSAFENWVLMAEVKKCSFYGFVFPGDQVELEVQALDETQGETKTYRGIGTVAGKKKIRAEFGARVIRLTEIETIEDQRYFFRILTREFEL